MQQTREKLATPDLKLKMDSFILSTQMILVEIQSFMNKWENMLASQMQALKNLEEANENLEDTVLDVLLTMHHHDLIKAVSPCKCQTSPKKPTRKKKHG